MNWIFGGFAYDLKGRQKSTLGDQRISRCTNCLRPLRCWEQVAVLPQGVRGTCVGSYMYPISAGHPQRTWTWGPRGQGAILLVNCDKDNPKSSSRDCMDDRVRDREGKDPES